MVRRPHPRSEGASVWNFAFGSNMHPARRSSRASLSPLEATPAVLHGWRLTFDMPGLPPIEPSMASIERALGRAVHGVLLHLSVEDFHRLERSEGDSRFYERVEVEVTTYDGRTIRAVAFKTSARRALTHEHPPSRRYLELLREGARLSGLDPSYCDELDALPHAEINAALEACGPLAMEAVIRAFGGRLRLLAYRYVSLLHRADALTPGVRRWVQAGMISPVVLLGAGLRAARRVRPPAGD